MFDRSGTSGSPSMPRKRFKSPIDSLKVLPHLPLQVVELTPHLAVLLPCSA